jgi:flagellar FliL protein
MAEEAQAAQEEAVEKKSGSSFKKILMIWVPLFLLQTVVAYFIVSKVFRPKLAPIPATVQAETKKKKSSKTEGDIGEIYLIEDVIVNPKGTKGRRFLNVSVALACESSDVIKELEKRDILVRDFLINLFTSRTIEQLDDVADKDSLRVTIMNRVNEMLPEGGILGVYFSNFILQ